MIIKTFDNGWGNNFLAKQFEQQIVKQYLTNIDLRTVLINNVWYTVDYHQEVMNQLRLMDFDQIVLVSMLDASIIDPAWYQEFNRPVHAIGYYSGKDALDFWALAVDQYFEMPDYDLMNYKLIDTAFMCLNRKPHWHRRNLYNQLTDLNLVNQGIVSMGRNDGTAKKTLTIDAGQSSLAPNSGIEQHGIANDIMSLGHPNNWQRHFLNVVTETQFDIKQTNFVSEKIYKPIVGCRPFLVYASDGAVDWLTKQKFQSYVDDFADITDLDLSQPHNIAPFLKILCAQNSSYWQSKYLALKEKIVYNKIHFTKYVTQQKLIVKKGIQCQI